MNNNLMLDLAGVLFNLSYRLKDSIAIIIAVGAIFATIQCFFGYRVFKFWIGVQGFILFGLIGIVIGYSSFEDEIELCLVMGLIVGGLGALLAMGLYKLGIFLQCFWTGSFLGMLIGLVGQVDMEHTANLAIIFGIGIGIIGVLLIKPLIMLSTGFSGGMTLGCIVAFASNQDIFVGLFAGIIISILGVLYQSNSDEKPPRPVHIQDDNAPVQNT